MKSSTLASASTFTAVSTLALNEQRLVLLPHPSLSLLFIRELLAAKENATFVWINVQKLFHGDRLKMLVMLAQLFRDLHGDVRDGVFRTSYRQLRGQRGCCMPALEASSQTTCSSKKR